jgi:hypothetical protein
MKCDKTIATMLMKVIGCVALACCALPAAHAADAANVAGTWTWTTPGRNGGPDRTTTLTLKVDGAAVTGTLATPGRGDTVNKTEITDGKITDEGGVTFKTSRERNGTTTTTTFSGKITPEGLVGTMKTQTGDNEPRSRTWKAKRPSADGNGGKSAN